MIIALIKPFWNGLLVMMGVVVIVFFLFYVLLPADPARLSIGQRSDAATLAAVKKELYLDQPVARQFLLYLNDLSPIAIHTNDASAQQKYGYIKLIQLNDSRVLVWKAPYLRRSYQTKKDVSSMLAEAFPGTLILATFAICFATFLGLLLGTVSALKPNSVWDQSALIASILGISAPSFFAGIIIAYVFGFLLNEYTGLSLVSPLWDYEPLQGKRFQGSSLVLPGITLAIRPLAMITQITRSSLLDVIHQDFIRTAYAKGLSRFRVIVVHAWRNAMNPILTSVSGWFAELLAGSFFIEYIFGWKGLGKITVDALNKFDVPVVMGSVLFSALIFILVSQLVDILYRWIDPRITDA